MPLDYTFERQIMLERQEGFREGYIQGCKERGLSYAATFFEVQERFSLSDWETEEYMQRYW